MNKKKLTEAELYCGVDTLQVKSETAPKENEVFRFVTNTNSRNGKLFHYRLNPDKANDNISIYNGTDYYSRIDYMLEVMRLKEPKKERIDIRFDSFDDNYKEFLKLNRLLILLVANKYNLENSYESTDPMFLDHLCIRAQNKDGSLQIENYNKSKQEPDDIVKNRLELRTAKLSDSIPEHKKELVAFNEWCNRLDNSVTTENFNNLIQRLNEALLDKYNEEKNEKGFNKWEFIRAYRHSIFTSRQMADFVKMSFGSSDPQQWAKKYKQRRTIEYFSMQDVREYVALIKRNGKRFFNYSKNVNSVQICTDSLKGVC